jgi:hypothetical protein
MRKCRILELKNRALFVGFSDLQDVLLSRDSLQRKVLIPFARQRGGAGSETVELTRKTHCIRDREPRSCINGHAGTRKESREEQALDAIDLARHSVYLGDYMQRRQRAAQCIVDPGIKLD